ncbi:MAG: PAS domain S-box protein [Bacteroidetes bacterium]|nr:PAS domain S-box protein [Bacteroidota bacterium]HET6245331.1 PAS domain S-box protein [Bacteroidia bacterium]
MAKKDTKELLIEEVKLLKEKIALLEIEKGNISFQENFFPGLAVINKHEKNIEKNEERLKLALGASGIGVWEWDISSDKINWSDSVYDLFEVKKSKEKLILQSHLSIIYSEDVSYFQSILNSSIKNNVPFELKHRLEKHKENWILCKGIILTENNGLAYKVIGNVMDITNRIKHEQLLLASQERLRKQNKALLELSGRVNVKMGETRLVINDVLITAADIMELPRVGLWVLNDEEDCLSHFAGYYNKNFSTENRVLELANYPVYFNAIRNKNVIVTQDVYSNDLTRELVSYCSKNKITSMLDIPLIVNGKIKGIVCFEQQNFIRNWTLDEQNFAGAVVNIIALAMEVSERIKAQEQLKLSEKSYYELFDNSPELIYIQDKNSVYIDVNKAVIEKYGLTREQIIGNKPDMLGASGMNDNALLLEKINLAWEGGSHKFNWWGKKKNEEVFLKEIVVRRGRYFGMDVIIASGRDISEQKKYENLLIEKEQNLSMVLNNIDYLTYSSDIINGNIELKYISPHSQKIIGFTTAEFISALKSNGLKDHYHIDDVPKLMKAADEIKNTKKSATLIYRFFHKTKKRYIWIEESIFPQFDNQGKRRANFGVLRDVTERVTAEQSLIKSEERYRLLFESNMAGVFRTTISGKIIECNKAFVDIFKYDSVDEIQGRSAAELYASKKEREIYIEDLKKYGSLYNYQIKSVTKQGKNVWLLASVTLVNPSEKEREQEILGTLIDITELKEVQETLLENEEKFKSIGESAPVGIFLTDIEGRPEYINPKLQQLIEIPLNDTVDKSLINRIHPGDFKQLLTSTDFALKNKGDLNIEFRLIGEKAQLIWVCLNATVRKNSKGEIAGWVGTVEDITDRKTSEDIIKESEQRFKLLSEVAIEGIVLTENAVVFDCNNRFYEMHGYTSKEEVIGKHVLDFLMPEFHQQALKSMEFKKSKSSEVIAVTKTGKPITIEISGMQIPYYGRKVRVSVLYDISQRKNIENSLKESERALSTLMSNLPGMAYRCQNNPSWTMEFASAGCLELTGYKSKELIKNNKIAYDQIIHPKDKERVWKIIQGSLASKNSFELEYRIITASGKTKWVWEQGEGVFDEKGKVKIIEGFITDISERKEFDSLIRQSRKSFKDLIDFSPVGVIIVQGKSVVFANPVARDILKISDNFRIDKASIFDYLQPEYHATVKNSLGRIKKGEKLAFAEVKVRSTDGAIIDIETNGTITNFLGKEAIQIVCHDISYRKQLHNEQLRAEVAEETNKILKQEISDREKAEKMLIETQKFTRNIIDSSLDIIWATDKNGFIIEFNEAAQKAFGFGLNEMKTQSPQVLYAVNEDFNKSNKTIIKTGTFSGEIKNKRKNGEIFTSYMSASFLFDENGDQIGSMGISRDITGLKLEEERKETQYAITRILSEAPFFYEAAPAILSAFAFGFNLDYGEIWLVNNQNNELDYYCGFVNPNFKQTASKKFQNGSKKMKFSSGEGLAGKIWSNNKTMWIEDLEKSSISPLKKEGLMAGYNSAFGFPIKSGKLTLGVFNFFSSNTIKENHELLNLLPVIGSQIGQFIVRKKAEEELRVSEERFKAIYNVAAVGIARVSLTGKFIQVNQRLCDIFGYTDIELYAKTFQEFTYSRDLQKSILFLKKLLSKKIEKFTQEKRYIHKNGSIIFVNLTVSVVKDEDGNPDYFVSVFEDISERKSSEEKIFKQAAKLNSIFESSSHQIWTLNRNYELTSFNQNYVRAINKFFNVEPLLGTNVQKASKLLLDEKTFEQINKIYKEAFKGIPQHFEIPYYSKEGKSIWLETFLNPIRLEKGKIEEISCIAQDITGKKIIEQQIKSSLKEKEVLLKEVHHRVKNNLQVISSILNLQSSNLTDKKVLDVLKESQDRIKTMAYIHESLYQSKDFSQINFLEYIDNLSRNLLHSYRGHNNFVDLKLDIDKVYLNLDLAIPCGLIINELVSNALKYAFPKNKKGTIFIGVKVMADDLQITVKDNGIGFPQHIVFKNTETLGLQLVTALSEQICATISMETKLDQGTSYILSFNYKLNKTNPNGKS